VMSPPTPGVTLTEAALLVLEPLESLVVFLTASQLTREPIVVTVSLRPPPLAGAFLSLAGAVSSRRRTTSIAFSSSMILGCLVVGSVSRLLSWVKLAARW
jgi:hypothetical protein